MVAVSKQIEIGGLVSEEDEEAEIAAEKVWRAELWGALKVFVAGYIDARTGLKGYEGCAFHLNKRWADEGRPVTAMGLRQALADAERNNFRLEWAYWFASQSAEVAELLARHVKPKKTPAERLADTDDEIRATLSHKQAEAFFRRRDAR